MTGSFFTKENDLSFLPFFEAEALALNEIHATHTIRTPKVIGFGSTEVASFLVLEFIKEDPHHPLVSRKWERSWRGLHKIEQPFFGWVRDNCIGSTPQPNPRNDNWVQFTSSTVCSINFNWLQAKAAPLKKLKYFCSTSNFSSRIMHRTLPCFTETCGEEMPVKTFQAFLSFMILPAITEIEKQISLYLHVWRIQFFFLRGV